MVGELTEDPFGTAEIRQRVLDAWAAAPARFREDANAEEDLVLGGYRDRLLIELAQNAADAATAAGVPGHLRLILDGDELRAANVGKPLDAAGVQGLATLRASAKQGSDSVGRYGVGFAAVLAVSDQPTVVSRNGGVRFSAADTQTAITGIPSLAGEVERRSASVRGSVPVLRLPFPIGEAVDGPPDGFDTEVRLPLRPGAREIVESMLAGVAAEILLGLPGLTQLDVDGRVLRRTDDGQDVVLHDRDQVQRWRVSSAAGELSEALLADRPIEEQERPQWTASWAVPVEDNIPRPLSGQQFVHAPTPSDEPLSLPLRLIASYPLAPDRRHVAPGPVSDHITTAAARVFGNLVMSLADDPWVLGLLPRPTLAAAPLDAQLGAAITARLQRLAWLPESPAAESGDPVAAGIRIRPDRATALDPVSEHLVTVLADVISGLLPASWSRRREAPVLTALGVRRMDIAGLIEVLSTVDRPATWWGNLYAALENTGSVEDRDALAAIPVPLADGRMAFGARGLLIPEPRLETDDLGALGLALVHPDALVDDQSRHLLERLGASPASAAGVLNSSAVQAAVTASLDEEDPEPIAKAVLGLVRTSGGSVETHPWLAELALRDAEGDWTPAGELVLPESSLATVLDPDTLGLVDPELVATFGVDPLVAVGVLNTFAVVRADGHELGHAEHDLDDENRWYDALFDRLPDGDQPPVLTNFVAVRDLDLVRPDRWARALRLLADLPADVFADAEIRIGSREPVRVPSYTQWWLSTHPVLHDQRPDRLRDPTADELTGLFDAADAEPEILRVLHCLLSVDDALADPDTALELLDRLGQPDRTVRADVLTELYPRLASALDGIEVQPPLRVRVAPDITIERERAVILDAPHLLPLLDRSPVPAAGFPAAVADLLDLPMATETVAAAVTSTPQSVTAWADVPGAAVAARRLGLRRLPGLAAHHAPLLVTGERAVTWWPEADLDHVDVSAGPDALGRALSWRHQRWPLRAALAEAFGHPNDGARLDAEDGVA